MRKKKFESGIEVVRQAASHSKCWKHCEGNYFTIIPAPRIPSQVQSGTLFSNHWQPY
ncbi:hypothetical protein ACFYKT_19250 [Cytobacillus sp. FJAT-53684]|uniref:Uncharacterized protein n=1 Tax=Cytobacillus mangrovibacter TaxID=3299024 RepID=A0ABW6K651_9BACI